jgi:hypothetical protein
MTRENHLAYSRGYQRGLRKAWGDHLPPLPPQEEIQRLANAAKKIRDQADMFCATIDPEDEWVAILGPMIDAFDEAMCEFSDWIGKQRA